MDHLTQIGNLEGKIMSGWCGKRKILKNLSIRFWIPENVAMRSTFTENCEPIDKRSSDWQIWRLNVPDRRSSWIRVSRRSCRSERKSRLQIGYRMHILRTSTWNMDGRSKVGRVSIQFSSRKSVGSEIIPSSLFLWLIFPKFVWLLIINTNFWFAIFIETWDFNHKAQVSHLDWGEIDRPDQRPFVSRSSEKVNCFHNWRGNLGSQSSSVRSSATVYDSATTVSKHFEVGEEDGNRREIATFVLPCGWAEMAQQTTVDKC
jgi:hypothetical protein